jgi:hypothetical protein
LKKGIKFFKIFSSPIKNPINLILCIAFTLFSV